MSELLYKFHLKLRFSMIVKAVTFACQFYKKPRIWKSNLKHHIMMKSLLPRSAPSLEDDFSPVKPPHKTKEDYIRESLLQKNKIA